MVESHHFLHHDTHTTPHHPTDYYLLLFPRTRSLTSTYHPRSLFNMTRPGSSVLPMVFESQQTVGFERAVLSGSVLWLATSTWSGWECDGAHGQSGPYEASDKANNMDSHMRFSARCCLVETEKSKGCRDMKLCRSSGYDVFRLMIRPEGEIASFGGST